MDAASLSALAAAGAAVGALAVAGVQAYVGHRQTRAAIQQSTAATTAANAAMMTAKNSGRHTVAQFRQAWIYKVIDTIRDHHSVLMNKPAGQRPTADESKALTASRTQLEILLNPAEPDTIALLTKIDEIDKSKTNDERDAKSAEMLTVARTLLKREWARLKDELTKD